MKSRLKSCHACTSLWGTELVIEFRLESHEILTNAETDWLTGDWDFGRCKNSKVDFFPLIILFPGDCIFFFDPPHTPTPPPPTFLNGPSLSVDFHIRVFFISVKQGNCMYERPRLNVEVELGSTIQFMCDLPLHFISFIYARTFYVRKQHGSLLSSLNNCSWSLTDFISYRKQLFCRVLYWLLQTF